MNANSVLAKGYEADIVFWPKNPKANFLNGKMNISYPTTKNYENARLRGREKTKPNSNPIQTQFFNFSYLCHSRESGNPSLEATVLTCAIYRNDIFARTNLPGRLSSPINAARYTLSSNFDILNSSFSIHFSHHLYIAHLLTK